MDKEEFRIKLEQINHLVEVQDYKGAMSVVDSIDWRRVKNVRTLCVVGEIYAANKRYEDSKEIFLLAYHRASIGKNILYRLIEVSLKMGDVDEAMDFYEEFLEVAPNDNTRYILKYKILKQRNAPLEEQIEILEEYKEREFTERWSYELAKLYYQAGEKDKCLDICNEMSIWFSDGKYVIKALELKYRLGYITEEEREKYKRQFEPNLITPEQAKALRDSSEEEEPKTEAAPEEKVPVIDSIRMDERDINNAESLQEKISKGIRDIFNGRKKEDFEEEAEEEKSEDVQGEMIKDISKDNSGEDDFYSDVPDLEPEEEEEKPSQPKTDEKQASSKEKHDISDIKMPELNIPQLNIKKLNVPKLNIPKMPDVSVPGISSLQEKQEETEEKEEDVFDFNLEDTILAAATAQGIEIPKDPEPSKEKEKDEASFKEEKKPVKEFEDSDLEELTEEDLQLAEEEFLNGPKPEKKAEELALPDEESEEISGEIEEEEELTEEEQLEKFIESIHPENAADPQDIVPREKKLTDDEKKLFTYLAKVPGLTEQLVETLCDVQMAASDKTSRTGNVIVMGGRECGKTRLISGLIPAICKELNMEASKVAYVFADQINGKDIAAIVNKLAGGFFVIENANQMTQETVEQLDKAMEFRTDGLTVIIEDEKIGMRKLIAKYPKFARKFTSMINIPVFTNDELVNFAKVYTKENGYTIDQMGMLALYNLISDNQKEDAPMNVGSVKELIDGAIAKSQGGIRKLKRNISKKRTDRDGFIVLYEKDFM